MFGILSLIDLIYHLGTVCNYTRGIPVNLNNPLIYVQVLRSHVTHVSNNLSLSDEFHLRLEAENMTKIYKLMERLVFRVASSKTSYEPCRSAIVVECEIFTFLIDKVLSSVL